MANPLPPELHSAAYFGDQRDFWWNADYVAFVARRLGLASARTVLDVGCGVGHWGRVLLPHLPDATLTGVDREPVWVAEAGARAAAAGFGGRTSYAVGDVGALPFPDASFDLVTCQTVLIHLPDVPAALREMLRVLRPGGRFLAAEPNNIAGAHSFGSARHAAPARENMALITFQAICERGKIALGEGDNSVGDLLPGLVTEAGLVDVACWISDRALALIPPYASPDQKAARDDLLDFYDKGMWMWSRDDARRYYLAGGGTPEGFEEGWAQGRAAFAVDVAALKNHTFHTAGGGLHYLVAGRRPETT